MFSGYYTIASGMLTAQRTLDVIGKNLVNVDTPGYRGERLITSSFEMELLSRQENGGYTTLGSGVGAGVLNVVETTATIMSGGSIQSTGRETDIAIGGNGFFNIAGNNGANYVTRNGNFSIDEQGYLCLPGFGRVLGEGGPIQVGKAGFSVLSDGTIYNANGQNLGRLRITMPADNATLERMDNGMFVVTGGQVNATGYSTVQYSLERSNVDYNQEMMSLIQAQRAFQLCSSALQITDTMDQKAVTTIAAV